MSTPARPAPVRPGLAWLVCLAVLLNGFAPIAAHAAPGEILRLAGLVRICSAASPDADRAGTLHAWTADRLGEEDDADSNLRAAHCALCLPAVDPFLPASRRWSRLVGPAAAAGPSRARDVSRGAAPERGRHQPRAPPPTA